MEQPGTNAIHSHTPQTHIYTGGGRSVEQPGTNAVHSHTPQTHIYTGVRISLGLTLFIYTHTPLPKPTYTQEEEGRSEGQPAAKPVGSPHKPTNPQTHTH